LCASLGLVAIVVGLPIVLLAVGANPLPSEIPSSEDLRTSLLSPDDGTLALGAIAIIAWLAWAFLAISVLVEIASQIRGVRTPRLPGLRLPQSAARSLVATAALLFIAAPVILQPGQPGTTPADAAVPAPTSVTTLAPTQGAPNLHAAHLEPGDREQVTEDPPAKTKPHTVGPGETLWSIARTHLDDGARYPELADLNRDVLGETPGFLEVGWVLQVPHNDDQNTGDDVRGTIDVELENGEHTVTVQAHDTLSEIAQTELDDPTVYPAIFKASQDITQPGGAHLTDPDMIDVGWTLIIPATNATTGNDPGKDAGGPSKQQEPGKGITSPGNNNQEPTPAEPAPQAQGPTNETDQTDRADHADDGDNAGGLDAPWLLIGLTGGGVVLAAGLYRRLQACRRAQFRARRPGRAIAVPEPALAPVEKTINTTGASAAATVEFMDEALRRLAGQQALLAQAMPAVAAVELSVDNLVLHLTDPSDLDAPWEGTADQMHWRCATDVDLDDLGPAIDELVDQPAPYPMLVTIGSSDDGDVWLLNCEEMAALTVAGDPIYSRDFARYLAAELAMNPWSRGIIVDCIGIAEEIAPMERDRIRYHQPGQTGQPGDRVAAEILANAVATIDRSQAAGADVVTGRAAQVGDDVWPARLLLVDAATTQPAAHPDGEPHGQSQPLTQLLELAASHIGRTGTAVVIAGDERTDAPGTVLHMTSNRRIQLAEAGLDLNAVGLTSDEAHGCAALLAQSEDLNDIEIPVDTSAEDGWERYATHAGSLRMEHTLPRRAVPATDDDGPRLIDFDEHYAEPAESVLVAPDEDYITSAATTAEDLAALAPQVPVRVRAEVEAADPTLGDDLAAWFAPDTNRPKLTLLGPVSAKAHGQALAGRKAYYSELLTYLALRRRHGVTPDEVAEAFNLKAPRVRIDVKVVRDWLGINPDTDTKHLPDAPDAPATKVRGVNVYQVDDGLLVDADLFRRLWARGQARGPAGIDDLRRALHLVTGRPFDQLRKGAWNWLLEGDRTDLQMQAAVADVAHLVATHSLEAGDLDLARFAVEKAMLAAPDEDTTQMNRAALAAAEGFPEEAERILRDEVCNRSDDGQAPLDLTARTEAIIRNHDWLATG